MEPCQRDQDVSEPVESPAEEQGFSIFWVFWENWEIAIVLVTILMAM